MTKDLAFAPASEVTRLLDAREVSSVELTEMFLGRIDSLNPRLNVYLTVTPGEAMAAASRADEASARGESLGPLHGVPVSIKDLEPTAGIRTTMGSLAFRDYVPKQDSLVVERVKAAGAVILGKTNTPEFGFSGDHGEPAGRRRPQPLGPRAGPRGAPRAGQGPPWRRASAPWPPAATGAGPSGYRPASPASTASSRARAAYPALVGLEGRATTPSPSPAP